MSNTENKGLELDRLLFFCDAIVAIAITLHELLPDHPAVCLIPSDG